MSESDKKHHMDKCSRHRAKYIPPDTPPHFWSIGFIDTQDCPSTGRRLHTLSLCSYIFFWCSVLGSQILCCLHLKIGFHSCARGRHWCSIFHYHWWTASVKPRLLFPLCRLWLLRTFIESHRNADQEDRVMFYGNITKWPTQRTTCAIVPVSTAWNTQNKNKPLFRCLKQTLIMKYFCRDFNVFEQ